MVKKTEQFDFDFPEWDDFQDSAEGGFQTSKKKSGKRKAITEFGGSFLSGIKKQLLKPETQRKFLENALPNSGYLRLFDTAQVAADNLKSLTHGLKDDVGKASKDFREPLKSLERTHRNNRFVPKKISEKIRGWDSQSSSSYDDVDSSVSEANAFASSMSSIFSELDVSNAATAYETKRAIQESSDKATATSILGIKASLNIAKALNETNAGISRLNAYNDQVTSRALRKSLELQFKHYAVAREQLDVLQQTRQLHEASYKALILNTGLPEAVKITNLEMAGQQIKRQLFGSVNKRVANNFKDIGAKLTRRMGENARTFIETSALGLAGGLDGFANRQEMDANLASLGMGESRASKAGGVAGKFATYLLTSKYGKKLGNKLRGNKGVEKYSDTLLNASDNLPHWFNRIVNERTNSSVANFMIDMLGLDEFTWKANPKVRGSAVPDLDKQAFFNVQSQLALTEVIPGQLSISNRFLEMIATGNPNVEAQHFDYETGKFTRESKLVDKYQKRLFGTDKAKQVRKSVDNIVRQMDSGRKLSPKAKNELRRHLLKTAQNDQANIDIRSLISTSSPLSPDVAAEVASVLGEAGNFNMSVATDYDRWDHKDMLRGSLGGSAEFQRRTRNVNKLMEELRDILPSNMQSAIDISRQGHTSILERLGAVDWQNGAYNLNREREIDFFLGKGRPKPGKGPQSPMGPPRPPNPMNPAGGPGTSGGGSGNGGFTPYSGGFDFSPRNRGGLGSTVADNVWPSEGSTVNIDANAFASHQTAIIEAIDRNSPLDSLRVSNELLDAIRLRLEEGIQTATPGDVGDNTTNRRKRGGFFSKLMAPFRLGYRGMKNYTKFMYGKVIPGMVKAPFKMAGGLWNGIKNVAGAKGIYDIQSNKVRNTLADVYVQGKKSPVLRAADLKAGMYIDQLTGKVITKFKDITGPVVDRENNVILTEEDFKAGLFTIRNGLPTRIITGGVKMAWSLTKNIFSMATKPYMWMGKGAVGAAKLGFKLLFGGKDKLQDVYVVGEKSPRLIAAVIGAGGYFNEDGSVIRAVRDIKGNILDAQGNVVLTVADMTKGIVDKYGNPIEEFTKKSFSLLRLAGSAVKFTGKAAWMILKGSAKLYGKAMRGIGKGSMALGKGVLGLFGIGKGKGKKGASGAGLDQLTLEMFAHQADKVDKIYDLLKERLPTKKTRKFDDLDGDGLRDGSRESWFSRVTKPKEETEKEVKDKKERGLFGLIMAAVSGIGTIAGAIRGWASNIFNFMRWSHYAKAAGSLMSGLGSMLGGRRGRGRSAGRFGRAAAGVGNFARANMGKIAAMGALAGVAGYAYGGGSSRDMVAGFDMLGKSEQEALKSALGAGGGDGSGDGQGGAGGSSSYLGNLGNAIIGGVGGEAAAILGGLGIAGALGLVKRKRHGAVPEMVGPQMPKKPTSKLGKVAGFFTQNKFGRLITAAGTSAGMFAGMNALSGTDTPVDPASAALKSMIATMGIDAALAYGLPWVMSKYKGARGASAAASGLSGAASAATGASRAGAGLAAARTAGLAGSGMGAAAGAATGASKLGLMSKLGRFGGAAGRFAGKAALPLALGMGAYDAYKQEGNMWQKGGAFLETAAPAVAAAGLVKLAANPVARAVGMQAGRSLAMGAASLIAGTIGWPVLLGAAAIGGAGYLAYKGYKRWFKKDKEALVRFRLAQYGFDLDDKKRSEMILRLEKMAMDCVTIRNDRAEFNKNLQAEQVVGLFGILPEDQDSVQKFAQWFAYRFRPIFLKAFAISNNITKKRDLHNADSLMDREQKIQYLQETNSIQEQQSPYDVMFSPFADQKEVPYSGKDVASAFKTAMRDVKKEKSHAEIAKEKADDELTTEVRRRNEARNQNRLDFENDQREATKRQLELKAAQTGSVVDKAKSWAFKLYDKVADSRVGRAASTFFDAAKQTAVGAYEMFGGTPTMSKSQKQWQLMVYKAFKTAGFSEMQARILTAEVGRENSYNPANLFGGHADPHRGSNLGMISWQGGRRSQLVGFLSKAGVLINGDRIAPGQPALDAQAKFVMWELRNTEKKAGTPFLANPNIDYKTGADLIGRYYIRWRIDDPKYRAQGVKNRDGFYNMLNQQLGGAPKPDSGGKPSQGVPALLAKPGTPGAAQGVPTLLSKDGKPNVPNVMGGKVGQAMGATGGFSAPAPANIATDGLKNFLATLRPDIIKAGAKCMYTQNNEVDIRGMNQSFMAIFYAMAFEYNQRTGKKIQVNSAYRSVQKQKALYDAWIAGGKKGGAVAKPGNSRHNSGVAIDINSANANELDSLGLLKKYNFHRPVRGEAWHLENHYFSTAAATQNALKQAEAGGTPSAAQQQSAANSAAAAGEEVPQRPKFSVSQNTSTGVITDHATGKTSSIQPDARASIGAAAKAGSTATPGTPSTQTATPSANDPPRSYGSTTTTKQASERATSAAEATGRRQEEVSSASISEQTNIMKQQLNVQNQMLSTLKDIKSALARSPSAPSTPAMSPQNFKPTDVTPPVSMSVKQ